MTLPAASATAGSLLNNVNAAGAVVPLDPADPKYANLLANLQGNILKGHGRDFTYNIFVRFRPSVQQASLRTQLKKFASVYVTSTAKQLRERDDFKRFRISGGLFGNLLLTAAGYEKLGFNRAAVAANLPEEAEPDVASNFLDGIHAHAAADLSDPPPTDWQSEYRKPRNIHALVIIADDDQDYLKRQARIVLDALHPFAEVVAVETGIALRTPGGEGIEHFGYVDGRSQPIYLQTGDTPATLNKVDEDGGAIGIWNPFEPLSRVLIADGFGGGATTSAFGSFFVFRKLEQDVLRFKMAEQNLADALGLQGEERERAGAMVVGRFEDGTPLTLSQTDGFVPIKENDFTYKFTVPGGQVKDDSKGLKCPFAAHIRKVNPRGDIQRQFSPPGTVNPALDEKITERPRRITRRGITYGERPLHPNTLQSLDDLPTRGIGDDHSKTVGLLFMCFQASIPKQFAFMQKDWCNARGFVNPAGTGLDPIIGQDAANPKGGQTWQPDYDTVPTPKAAVPFDFSGFVAMKGGEFFFAPSLPFFNGLTTAPAATQPK